MRNIILFLAAILLSLTAGRAVWAWLGEYPFSVSGATYVEFFQQLDKRIFVPIAVTGVGGTVLAGVAAFLYRKDRRAFVLLLSACACGVVGCLVTALVNVPINREIATWNPASLPVGYESALRRWWAWHHVRLVTMFAAMCLTQIAILIRR
jgi:uncharacterized membrane protein